MIDPADQVGPWPLHLQRVEWQADRLESLDREAMLLDEPPETLAGEEPQMSCIQNATLIVVEPADCSSYPWIPMGEIGHTENCGSRRRQHLSDLVQKDGRIHQVLEYVGSKDEIEP